MQTHRKSVVIVSAGLVWLALCLVSSKVISPLLATVMTYAWTITILLLPGAFACAGVTSARSERAEPHGMNRATRIPFLATALSLASLMLSYFLCAAVLSRVASVWWEQVKFGGSHITLGRSAVVYFAVMATSAVLLALQVKRVQPRQKWNEAAARASVVVVFAAAAIYALLGVSPFVEWRA